MQIRLIFVTLVQLNFRLSRYLDHTVAVHFRSAVSLSGNFALT